ncbi:DUF1223 domain-containing protein [Pseudosulfitobacter sp. SM2401]|uniref:DUF1223 domain-containing protein n=1 Tax=Pseudosulfitobacter sp. SM2401 TaxID=3350098 RepID=UPI0036F38A35
MKRLLSSTAAAFFALAAPAWAGSPVVVELFTSQGCSSCPPADAMLHELAERDDVIALALHVDYWDYIGWKDEFAKPAYSKRQREYAIIGHRRSVYTPQMVINGETDVVGAKAMQLSEALAQHAAKPALVDVEIARQGGNLQINAVSNGAKGPFVVNLVRYTPRSKTRITRGENAGHTLSYANVAHDWKIVKEWDGRAPLNMTADLDGDEPVVVIIQQNRFGPIMAAARLR